MSSTATPTLGAGSLYAARRREHLELVNKLRALGAEADLDLPRIAVIGNQSAGKSSLVEAISGISVPRDAGTCTRCPIECRMVFSEQEWRCRISIRWEYNSDGTKRDPVEEIAFGSVITNREDVEPALRKAQMAILNPSRSDSRDEDSHSATNELSFSRNVVCVDLSGPDLVDLAFVDMPGIIQNASDDMVKFVENLVVAHISGNCLILVTLPMSDDIENQKAMTLARQVDPMGARTIGVLTKPDTLTSGAIGVKRAWVDVIEGRDTRFPLKLGYYCTRQPDEDERRDGITAAQARAAEVDFFTRTAPWSQTICPQRFGTSNLVLNLNALLTRIIDESLPSIVEETNRQLELCETRLASLPPVISEPTAVVLNLVTKFNNIINAYIEGRLGSEGLVQGSRTAYQSFKQRIRSTAPPFVPFVNFGEATLSLDVLLPLMRLEPHESQPTTPASYVYLKDVRDCIDRALTRELPNNTPYVAKLALIKAFQEEWSAHVKKCVRDVYSCLRALVKELVKNTFGMYNHLEAAAQKHAEALLKKKFEIAGGRTLEVLENEETPFTQNEYDLASSKEQLLALYKGARANKKVPTQGSNFSFAPAPSASIPSFFSNTTGSSTSTSAFPRPPGAPDGVSGGGNNTSPLFGASPANAPALKLFSFTPTNVSSTSKFSFAEPSQSKPSTTNNTPSTPTTTTTGQPPASQPSPAPAPPAPLRNHGLPPRPTVPASASVLTEDERKRAEMEALTNLTKLGYEGIMAKDLGRLRPDDEYQRELEVMAEVRAYFIVAYKRIIDNVPLAIDHRLLRDFGKELQAYLFDKLGLVTTEAPARCKAYLAEDPVIVATREELISRKRRLLSVKEELANLDI